MKRTALVLLLVVSATALFATGAAEAPGRAGFDGDFTPPADAVFTSIELTGTVEMVDDHAVLTADGKTYLLAIPRIAWYADEVADGSVITVSGNLVEGVTHDEVDFDGDGHITVQQVEIDGETLVVGNQGGQGGRFDVATRGNFADDAEMLGRGPMVDGDESFGRGGYADDARNGRYSSDENAEAFGRGPMVDGDDVYGRGGYADDDDFGRQQMPRGRRI